MSTKRQSKQKKFTSDSGLVGFIASLVQGLHDHFNPALQAVEDVVSAATKRAKQK